MHQRAARRPPAGPASSTRASTGESWIVMGRTCSPSGKGVMRSHRREAAAGCVPFAEQQVEHEQPVDVAALAGPEQQVEHERPVAGPELAAYRARA